ncbi:acetyltransferase, GNAT family [[Clostridium] methylpentosum DSM 5476]|uniref:Acetyltransferase, GNAT family n=1 Tax=[Clostridium] methylpentosum DSM 5476 TaxID=537013 RepID=C0E8J1_9FIRM|nr:acetyltransferase, GNAT family [[Clostridium] methylpentosum DSM 5476]MDY3988086.1 GNAT family N-acetyltransferase [Massilioclostridium sp.]MEE1491584.1 GNAT family N-acetyltransferase [Massilioclostridium sp.]
MSVDIRICSSQSDIEAIARLANEIWQEHFTPIIGAGQVAYMVEKFQSVHAIADAVNNQGYRYYMAFENGELIGYCGVQPQQNELFLSKLYLRKDCRGRGISKQLLAEAVAYCKQLGHPSIYLTVNKHNDNTIAIYQRMGFTIDDAVVSDIGNGYVMDDYIMRLLIGKRGK